jgi:hypothetical protein
VGPQGADSGPEAYGSLGHQHQDLSFHLSHKLASGRRANPVQESARFSPLTRKTVLCCVAPLGGERLCPLGQWRNWCHWARRSETRTRHRVSRERCAEKLHSLKQRSSAGTLGCGLEHSTWLVCRSGVSVQVSASSGPPCCPSPLWGTWTRGEFRGTPLKDSFFSGERCRAIHRSSLPCNRFPGHYTGGRRASLIVAVLSAACRGLFVRGGGGLNHWALGGVSLCLCRQRHGPVSGQWPGRQAARSIEPPETVRVQLVCFAFARCGGLGTAVSLPAKLGWRPLDWPVGRSPDPLALAKASASLLFFSARMSRFNCRRTAGDISPKWAFRRTTSSSPVI